MILINLIGICCCSVNVTQIKTGKIVNNKSTEEKNMLKFILQSNYSLRAINTIFLFLFMRIK